MTRPEPEPATDSESETTVLVVDDDRDLADTFGVWLEQEGHEVLVAYSGDGALAQLDPSVDVVLLDRRMPDIPGDAVLEQLRERQGEYQVSMLTAVEPDLDILELPFDEYLTKPVTRTTLVDVVERLETRQTLDTELQELFRLASKLSALRTGSGSDVEHAREELEERIERKQDDAGEKLQQLDDDQQAFALVENTD